MAKYLQLKAARPLPSQSALLWFRRHIPYIIEMLLFVVIAVFYLRIAFTMTNDAYGGPDEGMRALVPRCIVNGNLLPSGYDACAIYGLGNWSYAFYPQVLGGYLSAFFMIMAKSFGASYGVVYMSGRIASVCFGLITLLALNRTIGVIYQHQRNVVLLRCIATIILGFWPQFAFLSAYMNNDIVALSGVSVLTFALVSGMKTRWRISNSAILALGITLCGLGYWNAYGFILVAVVLFIVSVYLQYRNQKTKMLTIIGIAAGISAVLVLPWFIINLVRYHDLVGMATFHARYEEWLQNGGQELQRPYTGGLFSLLFRTGFLESTVTSFVGKLGYLSIPMPWFGMMMYYTFAVLGIGLMLSHIKRRWQNHGFRMMAIGWGIASLITVMLFLYYALHTDNQAQGRYIIYLLIPIVIMVTIGIADSFTMDSIPALIIIVMILMVYSAVCVYFFYSASIHHGWIGVHWTGPF